MSCSKKRRSWSDSGWAACRAADSFGAIASTVLMSQFSSRVPNSQPGWARDNLRPAKAQSVKSRRLMFFRGDLFIILLQRHQVIQGRAGLDLDLGHPALAVWILGDDGRVFEEAFVDLDHLPIHGRVQVADRLDRLDLAETFAQESVVPYLGQLDVDDVGELIDGELRDADRAHVAFQVSPFVGLGVAKLFWIHQGLRHWSCVIGHVSANAAYFLLR